MSTLSFTILEDLDLGDAFAALDTRLYCMVVVLLGVAVVLGMVGWVHEAEEDRIWLETLWGLLAGTAIVLLGMLLYMLCEAKFLHGKTIRVCRYWSLDE